MKPKIFVLGSLLLLLVVTSVNARDTHNFSLPSTAKQISPNVFDLGTASFHGQLAHGVAIVHRKENQAREYTSTNTSSNRPASKCYGFISGARWRTTENYLVDPATYQNLDPQAVRNIVSTAVQLWEKPIAFNIFGNEASGVVDGADSVSPDGKNELMFGSMSDPGMIAVTLVWYIVPSPKTSEIIEFDQVYNDANYAWSTSALAEPNKMDFQNIATHELGHATGLADLYDTICSEQTMYGYANYGETKKRDLNTGDTNGIKTLYR